MGLRDIVNDNEEDQNAEENEDDNPFDDNNEELDITYTPEEPPAVSLNDVTLNISSWLIIADSLDSEELCYVCRDLEKEEIEELRDLYEKELYHSDPFGRIFDEDEQNPYMENKRMLDSLLEDL